MAIQIEDYTTAEQINPYVEDVTALIEAGEGKVGKIRVEDARANRDRVLFQKAANAQDKTARVVSQESADGFTVIAFRLKPKEAARPGRGGKGTQEAAEATAEVEAAPAPKPAGKRR